MLRIQKAEEIIFNMYQAFKTLNIIMLPDSRIIYLFKVKSETNIIHKFVFVIYAKLMVCKLPKYY